MKQIAEHIRQQRYFRTSMKFEWLDDDRYKETAEDEVFVTYRRIPRSIAWWAGHRAPIEVHTKPHPRAGRIVTNVYVVL